MSTTAGWEGATARHVPLAVATRGGIAESVHFGSVAVVDPAGRLLAWAGDPESLSFTRSACKPFQALPLLAHPDVPRYAYTPAEVAVLCASHSGEPRHIEAVRSVLKKAGCTPRHLRCGTHPPLYYEVLGRRPAAGERPTPLSHNCSGKHAGMLALARLLGATIEDYLDPEHPVQRAIREAVKAATGVTASEIVPGTDGCSAPNYAVPLRKLAAAYARLAGNALHPRYGKTARVIFAAMSAHPEMVSGTGRFDLALTLAGTGSFVSKGGAEGVEAIAVRDRRIGIAIKIADGATRALPPVTLAVLSQLGLLDDPPSPALAGYASPRLTNPRGIETGVVQAILRLESA